MEMKELLGAIEAILFAMGGAVPVKDIANAIEQDETTTLGLCHTLMDNYNINERGIHIIELEDSFQMCTSQVYYDTLTKLINTPKKHVLTDVMLETLSIVAYNQPVTKGQIEKIRGVKSDHAVNKLVEYNLIEEVGRLEAPGRPMLFGTTEDFLRSFGVKSVEDLPIIDEVKMEGFKQEALEEANETIPVEV
ncbi:MAG: SMC-Scp complex subunit ScpB [Lachnospiraceae bacterium]|nr:SMC-Scp complex subunit ScpB [Lachnospiraceae bacterium]